MAIWSLITNDTAARLFTADGPDADLTLVREFSAVDTAADEQFAASVVDFLEYSLKQGQFDSLAIAAPADVLDSLTSQFTESLQASVCRRLTEDLTNESVEGIARRLFSALWIVVADRTRARFLTHNSVHDIELQEQDDLVWPEAHMKQSEAQSDRPGRFAASDGKRTAAESNTDFRHKTAESFAALVVERLEEARTSQGMRRLIVVAAPLFLGELRKKLTPQISNLIEREIDKDWTKRNAREIAAELLGIAEDAGRVFVPR
jgi:protein required for attachment to host cells